MTDDLATVLADYRTGLDAELELLSHLEDVATRQQALPLPPPAEALAALGEERERHLGALLAIETRLLPLREQIASRLTEARALPGFAGVSDRHRRVGALVARVTELDTRSLETLQRIDQERRAAAQAIETGETTLAAYRRILQQPSGSPALFERRG